MEYVSSLFVAMSLIWGDEFKVIAHDFKHNITPGYYKGEMAHITPDRRRILTIEMAITALAAVRSMTITACLNIVVYIWVEFE